MEVPMESGVPTGPRGGTIIKVGPMSQPGGTLIRTHAKMRFPNQLYSWQLRVTCILICRGAVSHRAR